MSKRIIEVYRPCFSNGGVKVRLKVHGPSFSRDDLQPTMTAVFEATGVNTKEEAIAICLEKLAGFDTTAHLIMGGNKTA